MSTTKLYIKDSTIPNIGKGLFTKTNIKTGSIIVEFMGILRKPNEPVLNSRSNIYFIDDYVLECLDTDMASFSNDAINFNEKSRYLIKTLNSLEPFYKKHSNIKINAHIIINNKSHLAFLVAVDNINEHE